MGSCPSVKAHLCAAVGVEHVKDDFSACLLPFPVGDETPSWVHSNEYNEHSLRLVEGDPRADSVVRTIQRWLFACKKHTGCSQSARTLPDRLIDVGRSQDPQLRLIENLQPAATSPEYIALSYRWDTDNQFVTTRNRLEQFKAGMDEAIIPQTFEDVIWLSRRLGIEHVWIDAICIMQNDPTDWEEQSSKMAQIYRDSYLTVCASNAASVHHGFLAPRPPVAAYCGSIQVENVSNVSVYMSNEETNIGRTLETVIAD